MNFINILATNYKHIFLYTSSMDSLYHAKKLFAIYCVLATNTILLVLYIHFYDHSFSCENISYCLASVSLTRILGMNHFIYTVRKTDIPVMYIGVRIQIPVKCVTRHLLQRVI
jgi:hypothetical protein